MDLENKIESVFSRWVEGQIFDTDDAVNELTDAVLDYMDSSIAWYIAEIAMLKQENEQLQVDLMIAEEMFDAMPPRKNGVPMINIKRRSNFRHEK